MKIEEGIETDLKAKEEAQDQKELKAKKEVAVADSEDLVVVHPVEVSVQKVI